MLVGKSEVAFWIQRPFLWT